MNVLDLFSGIGGFSLGLERAGMRTVAFCEIDPFCRRVLEKHWPFVPRYHDVEVLSADRLKSDGIAVDVICGGFPCQDISVAGAGVGIGGSRSGLWKEYARLIGEVGPSYAIVENVSAMLSGGLGTVLEDLAALGYDAEWHCIPASAIGASHSRDRIWIVAHRHGMRKLQQGWGFRDERRWRGNEGEAVNRVLSGGGILRSHDGVPAGLDRIGAVGNAVVPQIPEIIGRAIMSATLSSSHRAENNEQEGQ